MALMALAGAARGSTPSSTLYPFPGYDLGLVRAKTRAEAAPPGADLAQAWRLYAQIQGTWMPGAPKPKPEAVAALDQLRAKLEAMPVPAWFAAALDPGHTVQTGLADRIGDEVFVQQRATPEYQALKALALVYLTGHELDRRGAAELAGRYLVALTTTHPWDWEVHGLYARFLVDAQHNDPAWEEAKLSVFLNPEPSLEQLKQFAFVGGIAAREQWPEIKEAIRQAATDSRTAELAIQQADDLFAGSTSVNVVQPRP